MTIDVQTLIPDVRDGLSDVPFDHLDDKLIFKDLQDAYDFVTYVAADGTEERMIRRCIIRYGMFISYRNYTSLAERRLGSIPSSSAIQLQTLLMQTYNCLSLISKYTLNPDLSLNTDDVQTAVAGSISSSLLDAT